MMDNSFKLLIAEDQPLVRAGFQHLLGRAKNYTIVAHTDTLLQAYRLCQRLRPAILVISLSLLPSPIRPTLDQLRDEFPQMKVLLLGNGGSEEGIHELLKMGVAGYVLKNDPTEIVTEAIHAIANGGSYFSRNALTALASPTPRQTTENISMKDQLLTKRETEIVELLIQGLDNRTIARELDLGYQTVRNKLCTIYRKIGVQSRTETIVWAIQQKEPMG